MSLFGSVGGNNGGNAQAHQGSDLKDIQTDKIGFKALAGEKKLKFLPTPWPNDSLPSPTSSLLSVASGKGLVAAAGPDALVLATTDAVRSSFASSETVTNNIQNFTPQATIPVPRVSQVAFSSDESSLVICADSGGGLAVYDVQSILGGSKDSAFQLATHGVGVRALLPNPARDAAHLFAVILTNGQLLMADLKQRQIVPGKSGPVLKEGVSCVSWSTKGKQLVAGLANGTAVQMTPAGEEKAVIPKPSSIGENHHITTIYWLANDDWFIWHTPSNNDDPDRAPESVLHLVHRDKGSTNFSFHKLQDPCGVYGLNRSPNYFVQRLREFPPDLNDMLIVASTASDEINLLTRSTAPLSSNVPANEITNTFTTTTMENDTERAQLPMPSTEDMDGPTATSPIGLALDLSSKSNVPKPIPAEEMDESPSPLPALYVLNNEGILCGWWIVYKDSVRKGTVYPGLVVAGGHDPAMSSSTSAPSAPFGSSMTTPQKATFGSPFGQSATQTPAFGQSGFASAATPGAFGGSSAMGQKQSPWGSNNAASTPAGGNAFGQPAFGAPSAFGKPAFGSTTPFGSGTGNNAAVGFGASSAIGSRPSLWGTPQTAKPQEAAKPNPFGSNGGNAASPFAAMGNKPSGFATFAQGNSGGSGFASLGGGTSGQSAFANPAQAKQTPFSALTPSNSGAGTSFTMSGFSAQPSFGSTVSIGSSMGASPFASVHQTPSQGQSSVFGQKPIAAASPSREEEMDEEQDDITKAQTPAKEQSKNPFGLGAGGFQLGSTFKETASKEDDDKDTDEDKDKAGSSAFTSGLGGALFGEFAKPAEPATPVKQPDSEQQTPKVSAISTTPATDPKQSEASTTPAKPSETPKATTASKDKESDLPSLPADGPDDDDNDLPPLAGSPPVKVEQPDSPLSETSPVEDEAPLPPDPKSVARPSWFNQPIPGSGPSVPTLQKLQQRPEVAKAPSASVAEKSSDGGFGLFGNLPSNRQEQSGSTLFGSAVQKPLAQERQLYPPSQQPSAVSHTPVGLPKTPIFPQPTPRHRGGSRSPSPIRSASTPVGAPLSVPPARPISRPASRLSNKPIAQPTPPAEEPDIEDMDADRVQAELKAPLVARKQLDAFIAHQDYAGEVTKPGIPGQIERVFRDINSMVDTLGLNARSLAEFIKGHKELLPESGRTLEDIEDRTQDEEWAIDEIEDLAVIQEELEHALDAARILNFPEMEAEIKGVSQEIVALRRKVFDLKKQISTFKDPAKVQKIRDSPLSSAQNKKLAQLRAEFASFQKQLVEAEDSLLVLRAKLASAPRAGGKAGKRQPPPTAEAVTNTIRKMTTMVEKKSGDIDVLEAQMRKLGLASTPMTQSFSSSLNGSRMSASFTPRSREGTPFATPTGGAKGRTFGFSYANDSGIMSSPLRGNELVLRDDRDEDEVQRLVDVRRQRRNVLKLVREGVDKRGRKVTVIT